MFVNSMSELFYGDVPDAFIRRVFAGMQQTSWCTFQMPTKRFGRLESLSQSLPWPANGWRGLRVETAT